MDLQTLISTDFESVIDFLKPITVGGTAVEKALRRAINTKEAKAGNGKYLASDTVFHFSKSAYASRPEIGTAIAASGQTWTILEVVEETLSNRWKCLTRMLSIQSPVTVLIKKLIYTKGDTGAQVGSYHSIVRSVDANVIWGDESAEVTFDNLVSPRKATVQFIQSQELTANHRLFLPDGKVMKLISWNGFDSIAQFFTATCEEDR